MTELDRRRVQQLVGDTEEPIAEMHLDRRCVLAAAVGEFPAEPRLAAGAGSDQPNLAERLEMRGIIGEVSLEPGAAGRDLGAGVQPLDHRTGPWCDRAIGIAAGIEIGATDAAAGIVGGELNTDTADLVGHRQGRRARFGLRACAPGARIVGARAATGGRCIRHFGRRLAVGAILGLPGDPDAIRGQRCEGDGRVHGVNLKPRISGYCPTWTTAISLGAGSIVTTRRAASTVSGIGRCGARRIHHCSAF